jgi:hypothetical protein
VIGTATELIVSDESTNSMVPPVVEAAALNPADTPCMTAEEGTVRPKPVAVMMRLLLVPCPVDMVVEAVKDGFVDTMLGMFSQPEPVPLCAKTVGVPVCSVVPVKTAAGVPSLRIPCGLPHWTPAVLTSDAVVGAFGPTKIPTVDVAVPLWFEYVPAGPVTTAVKVMALTEMTYTVCPFRKVAGPVNPVSTKPSLPTGIVPLYVKIPLSPLPITT